MIPALPRIPAGLPYGGSAVLLIFFLWVATPVHGKEFCGDWLTADIDATGGKYTPVLSLRGCDLTGGVSAYLQLKNSGTERLKVSYRAHTEEKLPKDDELVVEPGETRRGATCQQCSRRKGGIKLWEIVAIEVLPSAPKAESSPKVDPPAAPQPPAATTTAAPPEKKEVVVPAQTPRQEEPAIPPPPPVEPEPVEEAKPTGKPESGSGPTTSWDDLPPEFRPRK